MIRCKNWLHIALSTAIGLLSPPLSTKSCRSRDLGKAPKCPDAVQPRHVLSLQISQPRLSRNAVSLRRKCAKSIVFRQSSPAHRFYGGDAAARVMERDNFATVV